MYLEASDQPVAVLLSDALLLLVNEFAITLKVTICTRRQRVVFDRDSAIAQSGSFRMDCSLRIIVYGFLQQQHQVSRILESGGLFLQHPGETEFDRRVRYMNPQYLLPPGEDMPDIGKLSVHTCCAGGEAGSGDRRDALGEFERGQILNIFNTAFQSTGTIPTIEHSPRLATELKKYDHP